MPPATRGGAADMPGYPGAARAAKGEAPQQTGRGLRISLIFARS